MNFITLLLLIAFAITIEPMQFGLTPSNPGDTGPPVPPVISKSEHQAAWGWTM